MNRERVGWVAITLLSVLTLCLLYVLGFGDGSNRMRKDARSDLETSSVPVKSVDRGTPQTPSQKPKRLTSADRVKDVEDEEILMETARKAISQRPELALQHIHQADHLYGEHDEERRFLEIEANVSLRRIGHARSLADLFYRTFPDSSKVSIIERMTGYHPRPYGP